MRNWFLIPDAVALAPTDFYAVQGDMLALCAELGDRFAILNTRLPSTHVQQDIQAFRAGIAGSPQQLSHGAVYYPWLVTNSGATVPPAGAVAGAYVQTDRNRGVWKAPANVSLRGRKCPQSTTLLCRTRIRQCQSCRWQIRQYHRPIFR
jgi:hypothetical protein